VVSCAGVAAGGQPSAIGSGTKIVFGTGYAAGDATFTLNYSGEGPASTDREIHIVGNLEEDRITRAKIIVEKAGAELTLLGDVRKDLYKGPCDLVLAGAGHGILKGQVLNSIRSVVMQGPGRWELTSPDNAFTGDVVVEGGTLDIVGATQEDLRISQGGTLAPSGPLTIAGSLVAGEGATLRLPSGPQSSPVEVKDSLDLQSAQLAFGANIDPALRPGQTVVLIRYGSLMPGSAFRNLPEGAEVKLGSRGATISYGTSKDSAITLKVTR
jgi:autotransporter-associated beta strand protein